MRLYLVPIFVILTGMVGAAALQVSGCQPFSKEISPDYGVADIAVAGDGKGRFLAAGVSWPGNSIVLSVSSDDGIHWSDTSILPTEPAVAADPEIVHVAGTKWIVSWSQETTGPVMAMSTADGGQTWSSEQPIFPSGNTSSRRMAASTDGTVIITLDVTSGTEQLVYYVKSDDFGATYSDPITLPGAAAVPDIRYGTAPTNILWTGDNTFLVTAWGPRAIRTIDAGVSWTAPVSLPFEGYVDSLASNGGRTVMASIRYINDGVVIIRDYLGVARSFDSGETWTSVTILEEFPDNYRSAHVVYRGKQQWAIVANRWYAIFFAKLVDINLFLSSDGGEVWDFYPGEPFPSMYPIVNFVAATGKNNFLAAWEHPSFYAPGEVVYSVYTKKKLPDLTASWSVQPAAAVSPAPITTAVLELRNNGNTSGNFRVSIFDSNDDYLYNDPVVASFEIKKMRRGASTKLEVTIPAALPSGHRLFALVDSGFEVVESDEENNPVKSDSIP